MSRQPTLFTIDGQQLTPIQSPRTWGKRSTFWDEANKRVVRQCAHCKAIKPLEEFRRMPADKKFGYDYCCLPCNAARCAARHRTKGYHFIKKYGLTRADLDAMIARQDGACAICYRVPDRALHVDHCHKSGKVRALLCYTCNSMLGNAKDNPDVLVAGAAYLREHNAEPGGVVQASPEAVGQEPVVQTGTAGPRKKRPRATDRAA